MEYLKNVFCNSINLDVTLKNDSELKLQAESLLVILCKGILTLEDKNNSFLLLEASDDDIDDE